MIPELRDLIVAFVGPIPCFVSGPSLAAKDAGWGSWQITHTGRKTEWTKAVSQFTIKELYRREWTVTLVYDPCCPPVWIGIMHPNGEFYCFDRDCLFSSTAKDAKSYYVDNTRTYQPKHGKFHIRCSEDAIWLDVGTPACPKMQSMFTDIQNIDSFYPFVELCIPDTSVSIGSYTCPFQEY